MKIVLLSPYPEKLIPAFEQTGDSISVFNLPLKSPDQIPDADFLVSYGYRYILKEPITDKYFKRIVNLHISFLPWNGGADPNFWSFFDNTPKGVTIHWIDAGVDTGDIIAQRGVSFLDSETLATSFDKLQKEIERLFQEVWPTIRNGQNKSYPQETRGSYHRQRDKNPYFSLLSNGWNTPVKEVEALGRKFRASINASL